jgi:N utilization substance protein B
VQGLYGWLVGHGAIAEIEKHLSERSTEWIAEKNAESDDSDGPDFARADRDYFERLLRGVTAQAVELEPLIAPLLDRTLDELAPVERAILLLAAWEMKQSLEIPYRVIINEAVELAKSFGGTDGHRYVNGVLDRLARELRPAEQRGPRGAG